MHFWEKLYIWKNFIFVGIIQFFYLFPNISLVEGPKEPYRGQCCFLNFSIFGTRLENWKWNIISSNLDKPLIQTIMCCILQMQQYCSRLNTLTRLNCCHRYCNISKKQAILWWSTHGCWVQRILLVKSWILNIVQNYKYWFLKWNYFYIHALVRKIEKVEISKCLKILKQWQQLNFFSLSTTLYRVE